MPIFRYDSDGYPSSTSGDPEWKAISNIYRWTGSTWQKIKKIYRFNNNIAAKWQLIFQGTEAPQPKAPFSSLYRTSDNGTTTFSSGNTVRLSRGSWTESPTSYRLRIQTSQSAGSGYTSVADQTYNASSTPTAANTTNDTFISYTITDQDALHPSYYIKGLVTATNADGTTPLETSAVLLRIGFTLSNLTASSATAYGATFSWSISGVPDQSVYIYDQVLTIRRVSDNVVVKTVNVAAGTNSTTVNDSTNLSPNTSYYAKLVVTAYDSWFLTDSPTTRTIDNVSFTTAGNPPVNTVAPTIGPLNNRGYLPVSTTLTATQGTWSNVSGTTVYAYDWWKEDYITGALSNTGYTVNTQTYSVSDALDYIFVRVKATNTDGGVGTAVSTTYTLDQAVAVGNITPTSVIVNTSNTFSFSISHYPTSYVVDWGDGTSNSYTVPANTSTVNASIAKTYTSTGNKTVTITAQPGNKTSTTTVSVAVPTPTVSNATVSDITVTPSAASNISVVGSSSNIATVNWTNGSPVTSINVAYSGAGTNGNYTDSSSPFDTSTTLNYSSSGTISITITTFNNSKQARISWNQTNAASYAVTYTLSGLGGSTDYGNSSASSVNYDIFLGSISRTVTLNSITVYSGANQTGTSNTYNFSSSVTPTDKSSVGTGSGSVTYFLPKLATPTNVNASDNRTDGVLVTWTAVSGAAYYGVWYGPTPSYDSTPDFGGPANPSLITGTSYLDTSIGSGVTRDYYVQAFRSGNPTGTKSDWGGPNSGTRLAVTQYTVTWNANGGSGGGTTTQNAGVAHIAPSPGTRSGFTFGGYWDTPSGDALYGPISSGGSFTPPSNITMYARWSSSGSAPAVPTGLNNVYNGGTSYTFSWTAVSGATSYQIIPVHATSSTGTGASEKSSRNFTSGSTYDSSVDGGTSSTYVSFKVRATNSFGSSAYSAIYTPYR